MKKMVTTLGLAAAASAGALVLTGSPASAQTTQAPVQASVAHVQTSISADHDHHGYRDHRGYRWGHRGYYDHRHHHWSRHFYFYDDGVVFRSGW